MIFPNHKEASHSKAKFHKAKAVRQRRMELRRVKSSLHLPKSDIDGDFSFNKRIKRNIDNNNIAGEPLLNLQVVTEGDNFDGGDSVSHGSISVIGRRREMEDAVAAEVGFLTKSSKRYDFFGVYDGHGGSRVAQACRHWLHKLLAKRVEGKSDIHEEINWKQVMVATFKEMDEEVSKKGPAVASMGSTATVAVVGEEELVVANCGDSRAVLSRGGVAIPLSVDHKPERPDELTRIEVSGGRVIDWNGQRVLGVLATSRSIGDDYLKPYVIAEPEVTVSKTSEIDEFLILASDGLWDVVSNDLACQLVTRFLCVHTSCRPAEAAAAALAELAMARGSRDNISVIVVDLMRSRQSSSLHHPPPANKITTSPL